MRPTLEIYLKNLKNCAVPSLLFDQTLLGIEKENLRINKAAQIAQTPHPLMLGASLTHPFITTDYSESLLEMITPPLFGTSVLSWLEKLHTYVYSNLGPELLWAPSMPCIIPSPDDVPIAQYGPSHEGHMRTLYRVGLGYRYEKKMQTIAGIHVNYSLPATFWQIWQELNGQQGSVQTTIDGAYFDMLRNYLRYGWLIDYLFGASSALDRSFLNHNPPPGLIPYKQNTLYAPYACSLRMSDLGYHNKTQKELNISFNSVAEYAQGLSDAINTPYPPYQAIFEKYGSDAQINANLLQIEAEYYAPIRPKRVVAKSQRQSQALLSQGVEYLEVRAIDINPYEPVGITLDQIYFIEVFLLYCLLLESPAFKLEDQQINARNTQTVVLEGRKPQCELQHILSGKPVLLTQWADSIFNELEQIAEFLDQHSEHQRYAHAVKYFHERIKHPELLPSAIMLDDLFANYDSFAQQGLALSAKNKQYFLNKKLSELEMADFNQATQASLQQIHTLEAQQTGTFKDFLAQYFA